MTTEHQPGLCPHCQTQMVNTGAPIWEDYCPDKSCGGEALAFHAALRALHEAHLERERVRDAAPELLAALQEFVADEWSFLTNEELAYEVSRGNKMFIPYIKARAAIAKATT